MRARYFATGKGLQMKRTGRDPEYRRQARKAVEHFAARLGDRPVNAITAEDVSDFLDDRTYPVTAYNLGQTTR